MTAPMAKRVAAEEPETAANKAQDMMVAKPIPPGNQLVAALMMLIKRLAMLPRAIIAPAMINIGIANNTWLSMAVHKSSIR